MSSVDASPGRWRRRVWLLAAGAVALRLGLLLGRGDYVAFDEGWYLLLGRSLWAGEGYRLTGLRHVALSPLFPIVAGGVGRILGDPVWAGRLVGAVASGLVVVPCWSVFRRLAAERTAFLACVLVATAPSLAPFVAPYWIGWDLWVGAGPLAHLLLYGGFALFLRARGRRSPFPWLGVGALFALGYLARPEVVIPFGILGLVTALQAALRWIGDPRRLRPLLAPALMAVGFGVVAAPYWAYLHDATGRWTLTGRGVQVRMPSPVRSRDAGADATGASASRVIEGMLWRDVSEYVRRLYSLNEAGTAMANGYWGVREADVPAVPESSSEPDTGGASGGEAAGPGAGGTEAAGTADDEDLPGSVSLYLRALGIGVPLYIWPLVLLGLLLPDPGAGRRGAVPGARRRPRRELLVGVPLLATSALVAGLVAADPRTQLFLVPWLLFYAARGLVVGTRRLDAALGDRGMREGFLEILLVAAVLTLFVGTHARRLHLSLTLGSPHHVVGEANHRVAQVVRGVVPEDEPVMSWHPALALFAGRDWRVLPLAGILDLVRYSRAIGTEWVVLSIYYPPRILEEEPADYLILRIPPSDEPPSRNLVIDLLERGEGWAVGVLRDATTPPPGEVTSP